MSVGFNNATALPKSVTGHGSAGFNPLDINSLSGGPAFDVSVVDQGSLLASGLFTSGPLSPADLIGKSIPGQPDFDLNDIIARLYPGLAARMKSGNLAIGSATTSSSISALVVAAIVIVLLVILLS